jgi:hypothetical protein
MTADGGLLVVTFVGVVVAAGLVLVVPVEYVFFVTGFDPELEEPLLYFGVVGAGAGDFQGLALLVVVEVVVLDDEDELLLVPLP